MLFFGLLISWTDILTIRNVLFKKMFHDIKQYIEKNDNRLEMSVMAYYLFGKWIT